MSTPRIAALLLLSSVAVTASTPAEDRAGKLGVLLLSGMNNHNWRETTPALKASLEASARFEVTVLEKPSTMTRSMLEDYDVVVSNFNTFVGRHAPETDAGWSAETKKSLTDFVRGGKGHVTVHAGSSSFYDWPQYGDMVLGRFRVGKTSHGRRHEFPVRLKSPNHPILRGLTEFRTFDELWHDTELRDDVTVLATAHSSRDSGGSGKEEPIAVTGRFGEGRSFFLVLGHDTRGISSPGFHALLRRGTEWAATGGVVGVPPDVTSKASAGTAQDLLTWRRDESSLALVHDGRPVWRFRHDEKAGKPHFDTLAPLGGPSVTWSMPPDHVWHYGLWFSWKYLNDINYWEEDGQTHRGEGHTSATRVVCTPREDHSARIEVALSYHPSGKPPEDAVLTEVRSIEVSPPKPDGSYRLDWTARFTAGAERVEFDRTPLPHQKGGKTYGGYAGLSLRMRNLKERRALSSSGPIVFGPQNRFRGKATAFDYSGVLNGETVGVAICDHPENVRTPSPWYAIRSEVMTFFSPAVICFEPFVLPARESLELRYRVIVHNGRLSEQQLQSFCAAFRTE